MSVTYYRIKDLNLLGKEEDCTSYLFKPDKGWIVDNDHILMDRLMGYDESEPDDSPYKIGNTSILDLLEELSENEAQKFIENL
nr:hypothetical protein [uncultured Clostridium sp.]